MLLLFVALVLTGVMVLVTCRLRARWPEERFSRIMACLIPVYLLVNWTFTLFLRVSGERIVVLVPLQTYLRAAG